MPAGIPPAFEPPINASERPAPIVFDGEGTPKPHGTPLNNWNLLDPPRRPRYTRSRSGRSRLGSRRRGTRSPHYRPVLSGVPGRSGGSLRNATWGHRTRRSPSIPASLQTTRAPAGRAPATSLPAQASTVRKPGHAQRDGERSSDAIRDRLRLVALGGSCSDSSWEASPHRSRQAPGDAGMCPKPIPRLASEGTPRLCGFGQVLDRDSGPITVRP